MSTWKEEYCYEAYISRFYRITGFERVVDAMEEEDVSKMNPKTVLALMVGVVRAERFCDGALLSALKSGAIIRLLERLQEIAEQEDNH